MRHRGESPPVRPCHRLVRSQPALTSHSGRAHGTPPGPLRSRSTVPCHSRNHAPRHLGHGRARSRAARVPRRRWRAPAAAHPLRGMLERLTNATRLCRAHETRDERRAATDRVARTRGACSSEVRIGTAALPPRARSVTRSRRRRVRDARRGASPPERLGLPRGAGAPGAATRTSTGATRGCGPARAVPPLGIRCAA